MKPICPKCGDSAVTLTSEYQDYECGTTWDGIEGWQYSNRCRERARADDTFPAVWPGPFVAPDFDGSRTGGGGGVILGKGMR